MVIGMLVGCKTVEVSIPAAYPLASEKALSIQNFQGEQGKELAWHVSAKLKVKLPNLPMYQEDYLPKQGLIMQGQVLSWHIDEGQVEWGSYDEERHRQYGSATRSGSIHARVLLLRKSTGEIVWADTVEEEVYEQEDFDFESPDAIDDADAVEDLLEKKVSEALVHLRLQRHLERKAKAKIPSKFKIKNQLLRKATEKIIQPLYDRVETHYEFK
jgi:hypothetical protein